MIRESVLQRKSVGYADRVVACLKRKRPPLIGWASVHALIEAAHFNGFQSGVVWQKAQEGKRERLEEAGE